jgi:hypothetical protein
MLKNVLFLVRLHHKLGLCYTLGMNFDHQIWDRWADTLYRWGLRDFAATMLEAAGPLTILGAQVVYILQPILGRWSQTGTLPQLAALLEQPDQVREFIHYLREEPMK